MRSSSAAGICTLLCGCDTFEEAIELAAEGNNETVDKLVKDIYGRGYDSAGLPGETVAASFGKMAGLKNARKNAKREDLARATLVTVMNNLGQIALNAANQHRIQRIVFVGASRARMRRSRSQTTLLFCRQLLARQRDCRSALVACDGVLVDGREARSFPQTRGLSGRRRLLGNGKSAARATPSIAPLSARRRSGPLIDGNARCRCDACELPHEICIPVIVNVCS